VLRVVRRTPINSVDPFFASTIAFVGLCFGSFLNVCIYRLPLGKSVVTPRSAWYLFIELLTGALFLGCYAYAGLTLTALKFCTFGFLLLGLIFTDAETKLLPDKLTLPGLGLGILFSLFVPVNDVAAQFVPGMVSLPFSADIDARLLSLLDSLLGAAVGASFIYGAGAVYLRWRGAEGMGFGDVKLMAMVGAFLGIKLTIFTIFTASLAGSFFGLATVGMVWIKRTRRFTKRLTNLQAARRRGWQSAQMMYRNYQMPFGVFLGSMALVALFVGNDFLRWYGGFW
jgi:leader peptidase (prepilin peptidase)/N-methyltransferase